jgi:ATP-binding cassette subfamily B multidrug efflux pump
MNLHRIDIAKLPEPVPDLPNRLFPFLWYFLRQIRTQMLFIMAVSLTASVLDAGQYYFIKIVIDGLNRAGSSAQLVHDLWPSMTVFVLFCLIIQPILSRYVAWLMANIRPAFTNLARRQLALYMHNHSYGYFQEDFAGRLSSKVIETPSAIAGILETLVGPLGNAVATVGIALTLFAQAGWMFAAVALLWMAGYALMLRMFIPRIHVASKQSYDQASIIRGRFVDTLTNILTVKLFARRDYEDRYLLDALGEQARRGQKMMHTINSMQVWLEVLSSGLVGGTFAAALFGWQAHHMSAGDIAMVLPLAIRLMNMSWWMSNVFTGLFESFGQVQEGMETITVRHTVTDRSHALDLKVATGRIEFRDVDFAYGPKTVFEHFNLDIPPGQKVGLIGPSGAGKSTFVQLLLRLYDLQSGAILIDGQPIDSVRQDSLRGAIAVIPQATDLLHRSLRDNIRYGRLEATEEEIVEAARRAHADEFIPDLIDKQKRTGYDAFAGERGVKLFGGQRQRVAIARAILKNAPILVLDEATSALDSESEKLIQDSLQALMEGKTVIAIAHRLSTIAHMDRLVVLDRGRIVEDGSHEALLAQNGLYARLWRMQSGGFLKQGAIAAE